MSPDPRHTDPHPSLIRHCEERSDAAIQGLPGPDAGAGDSWIATPQAARNDGIFGK